MPLDSTHESNIPYQLKSTGRIIGSSRFVVNGLL